MIFIVTIEKVRLDVGCWLVRSLILLEVIECMIRNPFSHSPQLFQREKFNLTPKPKMVNQGLQLAGYLLGLMSGLISKILYLGIMNYFVIITCIMSHHFLLQYFQLKILACGTLITCVMPEWRKSDLQGQVIEMQISKQGIWWNCMFFSTGNWHCDDYDRVLLGLPAELQTARALMVLACILGFLGYCLSQVGLGCTTFMEDNQASKRKSEHFFKKIILYHF